MDGNLQKLKITAYKEATFEESEKISEGEFMVRINPETYALDYKIKYSDDQASGTSGDLPKFDKTEPLSLGFKFIFDSTGALPGTTDEEREKGIASQIAQFKKVVFDYVGEKHAPPFLEIIWGDLLSRCVLTGMKINYKLFRPDGKPVRAEVDAKFKELVEPNERIAQENDQSPDLTHIRSVKEGDTLPLFCKDIYGDPKYYIEVARVNKLISFRNLKVGQKIIFPPLVKI
ncbi:CIS tube protein [Aquimarina algiphila]|uniref:LysM peptidoglycan-binding domain-containing protein n=1 Tax=Aquimarina algiphila TaxID=2047982 RepID=A0A554VPK0_9FLAO|nr:LysM peptidoglycan-binding domain-containing protein [Aquimarina algiphila]TSE10406.1 LysM peptidoglycan-binding domain-containing protein [Aquimarina algiphila]